MKSYVLYSTEDGRILSSGTSFSPEKLIGPGQSILYPNGPCDPCRSYVEDGCVKAMPERPGDGYEFNYATKQWEPNLERLWHLVRERRDQLIGATDWRVMVAAETGVPLPREWSEYRQALREITNQSDPTAIAWPERPT